MGGLIGNGYKNIFFNLFFSWLFTLSAIRGIMSITLLDGGFLAVSLICLLFSWVFSVVLLNKKTIFASVVFLIFLSVFLYSRFSGDEISPYWLSILDSYVETRDFILGYSGFSENANNITLGLLAFSISFISVFLIKMKYSYLFIFAIGTGLFIAVNSADLKGYDYAFLPMLFCLIMLYLKRANKTGRGSFAVVKFAPVTILVMAAAVFVPMPEKRLTQEQLEYAYEEVYWYFREPFMPKYFSPSSTGFEDEKGRLGGSVDLDDEFIMNVYADSPTYLSGSKRGIYTGYSWIYTEGEEFIPVENIGAFNEGISPIVSIAQYFGLSDAHLKEIGIEKKQLTIHIGKNRTGTIFTPNNLYDTLDYEDYSVKSNSEGDLRADPAFKSNESYTIYYYDVDYDEYLVNELCDKLFTFNTPLDTGFYAGYTVIFRSDGSTILVSVPDSDIKASIQYGGVKHGEYLYNKIYGQAPKKGFYKYAAEAFKSAYEGCILQDPVSRIYYTPEEFVALYESGYYGENLFYSLLMQRPESEIFENISLKTTIEYFQPLVDSALAYENEFAPYAEYVYENYLNLPETLPQRVSDLAYEITKDYDSDYIKMLAIERYLEKNFTYTLTPGEVKEGTDFVDGFLFESKKGYCTYFASAMAVMARTLEIPSRFVEGYITASEKNEEGYYPIHSSEAHAWAELYFEGIGWIPFDATPPEYVFTSYYIEENKRTGDYYFGDEDIFGEEETLYFEENMENIISQDMNENAAAISEDYGGEEEKNINIFGVVLLLFISYVGLRFLFVKAKLRAIEAMTFEKAVMAYYKETLDVLKFLGFHKKDYETAEGYALRIKATIPVNYRVLEGITKAYSSIRYGKAQIREKELVIARHAYYSFYNEACSDNTKIRFFIHRYIKKIY